MEAMNLLVEHLLRQEPLGRRLGGLTKNLKAPAKKKRARDAKGRLKQTILLRQILTRLMNIEL